MKYSWSQYKQRVRRKRAVMKKEVLYLEAHITLAQNSHGLEQGRLLDDICYQRGWKLSSFFDRDENDPLIATKRSGKFPSEEIYESFQRQTTEMVNYLGAQGFPCSRSKVEGTYEDTSFEPVMKISTTF